MSRGLYLVFVGLAVVMICYLTILTLATRNIALRVNALEARDAACANKEAP